MKKVTESFELEKKINCPAKKKKAKLVISETVAINNNNLIYSNLGISNFKKTYKLSGKEVKVGNIDWDAVPCCLFYTCS